jgi:hypothetical protein
MHWQDKIKSRYTTEGFSAFTSADKAFQRRLLQFCARKGITISDDNPEGRDWIVLLKDGTELYVDRRSYIFGEEEAEFWVEFNPNQGGIVAKFFDPSGKLSHYEIIVPNDEILTTMTELD